MPTVVGWSLNGNGYELQPKGGPIHKMSPEQLAVVLGTSLEDGQTEEQAAARESERDAQIVSKSPQRRCCPKRRKKAEDEESVYLQQQVRALCPVLFPTLREGNVVCLPSIELTVGDVVELSPGAVVPATSLAVACTDAILFCGTALPRAVTNYATSDVLTDSLNVLPRGSILLRGTARVVLIDYAVGTCPAADPTLLAAAVLSFDEKGNPAPAKPARPAGKLSMKVVQQIVQNRLLLKGRREGFSLGRTTTVLCKQDVLTRGKHEVRAVLLGMHIYGQESFHEVASTRAFQRLCVGSARLAKPDRWVLGEGKGDAVTGFSDSALQRFHERWGGFGGGRGAVDDEEPLFFHPYDPAGRMQLAAYTSMGYAGGDCEEVLPYCKRFVGAEGDLLPLDAAVLSRFEALVRMMEAHHGVSVYAIAEAEGGGDSANDVLCCEGGLVLLGLVGLYDPPAEGVGGSIAMLRMMGLDVRLVVDSASLGGVLAQHVGLLEDSPHTLSHRPSFEEDEALEAGLLRKNSTTVMGSTVYSELVAGEKMRIVQLLQAQGSTVLVVGGGVDDIPMHLAADTSIALSTSPEALQELSDGVLVDSHNLQMVVDSIQLARNEIVMLADPTPLCPCPIS